MDRPMKFAAVQLDTIAMEVNHNVHKALHWARRAFEAGAAHVFFHEGLTADYTPDPVRYGRSLHSHEVYGFSKLAERYDGVVALGLNEVFEGRPYITCVYLSKRGIEGVYRKSYLWPHQYSGVGERDAAYDNRYDAVPDPIHRIRRGDWVQYQQGYRMEQGILGAGDGTKNVPVGNLRIGTLICADSTHPLSWVTFKTDVPDMIFFQSNSSGGGGPAMPGMQRIARELGIPIVVVNRVGFSYHHWMRGGSFMVADDGAIAAQANQDGQEEAIYATWDTLTPRRAARAGHQPGTGLGAVAFAPIESKAAAARA
jgi:predicted amidohydrolase